MKNAIGTNFTVRRIWPKSIAIEAGELLECFQWNAEFDQQKVCEELADVMNYCLPNERKAGRGCRNDYFAEAGKEP